MPDDTDQSPARVFLCFAADDHPEAERFRRGLESRGVTVAGWEYAIGPGENIVLATDTALRQSDYFVLIWSRNTAGQEWIGEVWASALAHGLRDKRRFLFVVRLDRTPVPPILAARPYLDAFDGRDAAITELVATWSRERRLGDPVLPAPGPADRAAPGPDIVIYVHNRDLAVYHALAVPAYATGQDLRDRIHTELRLPDDASEFGGRIGMRFGYEVTSGGEPLPNKPLPDLGLADGDQVDLEVEVTWFGPHEDGDASAVFLGDAPPRPSPALARSLAGSAFAHLMPARGQSRS